MLYCFRKVLKSTVSGSCIVCSSVNLVGHRYARTRYSAAVIVMKQSLSMEWMIGPQLSSAIIDETNHAFMFAIHQGLVVS